ncbi:hypothetical protein IFM89_033297 [Coptis chinensis]|uniref:Small ribosomal subunit protein mS38 n=1 Tax=Coptis chinensis TaxID=261450 RepID=A0A835HP69_9MAGN|nr:hypothetical protein IFM89_033297 [Coptis chinensis]
MAAALFNKLMKKSSSLRSITSLNKLQSPKLSTPLILVRQPRLNEAKPNNNPSDKMYFYPSFPFGYFLDPISVNGVNQLDEVVEDVQTIWADSVKKKRKKKMNKHKYRKLKKRLRRKSRT